MAAHPIPSLVDALLDFSESKAKGEDANEVVRALLKKTGILDQSSFGHIGSEPDTGYQVIVEQPTAFLTISILYDESVAPLILKKGERVSDVRAAAGIGSCWTNGSVCCGSMCTDHVVDPCASGFLMPSAALESPTSTSKLDGAERAAAAQVATMVGTSLERGEVPSSKATSTEAALSSKVMFAQEASGEGGWYDWLLPLSNGASLTIQCVTDRSLRPLVIRSTNAPSHDVAGAFWGVRLVDAGAGRMMSSHRVARYVDDTVGSA